MSLVQDVIDLAFRRTRRRIASASLRAAQARTVAAAIDVAAAAQWPETTVLVPVGAARWVEFTADAPGDWAMHCHMTLHVMMQMSHGLPNMLGMDARGLDERIRRFLPGYMTMGRRGWAGGSRSSRCARA